MAFTPSQSARILVGALSAAAYARTAAFAGSFQTHDVTTLADTAMQFIPGVSTSTFQIAGPLDVDGTSNGFYDQIFTDLAASTTAVPITYGAAGIAQSARVQMMDSHETQIAATTAIASSADWSLSSQTTGLTDYGLILATLAAITSDTNGSSVNNGASTANGGVAHLHVTAFSGLTSNDITIEHSTNDSVWATLGTFTQVTGLTWQRLEIAAGTTVNQYLRVVDNVTGTGSCTRAVAFARR